MSRTFPRTALVDVVLLTPALADPASTPLAEQAAWTARAGEVRAWATAQGYALEALPDPAARTAGDPDPAARRRLGRQDARLLAEGLRRLAGAARVQALLVGERDAHGQAGRAWFGRVLAAAEQAGIELPRATRVAPTVPLDPALLERRIALEAG